MRRSPNTAPARRQPKRRLHIYGGCVKGLPLWWRSLTLTRRQTHSQSSVWPPPGRLRMPRAGGRELAKIHALGAAAFGAPPDGWDGPNYIGRAPQECTPTQRWAEFYVHQRVLPFAQQATRAGNLSAEGYGVVQRACDAVLAQDEDAPLARIHGDLWSGNLLFGTTGPRFIDPAAHGGHPLTDIAMLELFGAPHWEAFVEGYREAGALDLGADWQRRIPLHQLHPLAVHAYTHGPSYGFALVRAAEATLKVV